LFIKTFEIKPDKIIVKTAKFDKEAENAKKIIEFGRNFAAKKI